MNELHVGIPGVEGATYRGRRVSKRNRQNALPCLARLRLGKPFSEKSCNNLKAHWARAPARIHAALS